MEAAGVLGKKKYLLFALLFMGWIIDSLGLFGMNIVIIPISKELNLDESQTGMILSSFFLSSALMTLIAGWVSDRFGSRKIVIASIFIFSLFSLFTGMIWSFASLILARLLVGLADGCLPTASAVALTEIFPKQERARAKSFLLSAQMIGATLASIIAAAVAVYMGWRGIFYITGGVGIVVALLLGIYYRPPSNTGRADANEQQVGKKLALGSLFSNRLLWTLVLIYFGASLVNWGSSSWIPSYLEKARHLDLMSLGTLSMIPNTCGLLASLFTGWMLDKRWSGREKQVIISGAVIAGIFLYLMFNAPSIMTMVTYQALFSIGIMSAIMAILTLPLKVVPPDIVGSFMGILYFLGAIAGTLAPTVMGFLITMFGGSYAAAFWFLIAMLSLPIVGAITLKTTNISQTAAQ
ncbi:MFS transporter [Brevibacillus reuszeri]|uniref:MFS transporter n=1 Tax=Brevibacillus reuszeri TaxID=54915 RepID=UPI0028972B23|nr:MFS transporter [Brevibacillus reuszeri]